MPGRRYSAASLYRYGFNGKENDNEVKGEGNQQDYGMRIYDTRLVRFLSVDPLTNDYPWFTPYHFAGNMPIWAIDIDGMEGDKKPNANENKTESEEDKNKAGAMKSLAGKLDEHLAGGEAQNENRKSFLRSALRNKAEEIQNLKNAKSRAFEDLLNSDDKSGEEGKALVASLNDYDAQINSKQQQFAFLTTQLYKAVSDGKNIGAYNKWLDAELGMINYGTSAMATAASFLPSGGSSAGFFLSTTEIRGSLFSLKGGYGLFGKNGLRIGSYKIEAMYATPRVGFGTGTLFSIKQVGRTGGNLLRWDYGVLHGSQKLGLHSTFRFNMFGKAFGGSKQLPWQAPFKFWKYPK
jgi:RHS repeat-associated protein